LDLYRRKNKSFEKKKIEEKQWRQSRVTDRTLQTYGLEDLSQAAGPLVVLQKLHKTQACPTDRR